MRLRRKPHAKDELCSSSIFIPNATEHIGRWHSVFEKPQRIWLELGCGKGGFMSVLAPSRPDINFIAIDIKYEVLHLAKRKIEAAYSDLEAPPSNIRILAHEIMQIHKIMNAQDVVDRIYINFCNPWYKNTHRTRRLTHPNQLKQYDIFLKDGGEIYFKTDFEPLFSDSIKYFEECGFHIDYISTDLKNSGFQGNIETEHEKYFMELNKNIMFLIARKQRNLLIKPD